MGRRERVASQRRRDARLRRQSRSLSARDGSWRTRHPVSENEWVRILPGDGRPAGIAVDRSVQGIDWTAYGLTTPADGHSPQRCEQLSIDACDPYAVRVVDADEVAEAARDQRTADAVVEAVFADRHPAQWRRAIETQRYVLIMVCDLAQLRSGSPSAARRAFSGAVAGLAGIVLHTFPDGSLGYWHNSGFDDIDM